jgi:hypothetical protein
LAQFLTACALEIANRETPDPALASQAPAESK